MNKPALDKLPNIIDISALSVPTTEKDVVALASVANKYNFIASFVMPCHIKKLAEELGADTKVIIGAPIGFPTGTDFIENKVLQVKEAMKLGCKEFDMVISVGKLKSGNIDYCKDDISRVFDAVEGYPLKVILEVTYLTDDEIKIGSEIVAKSGAKYVKTSTGYSIMPTEIHHVETIKQVVGDSIKIKVAGGVKNLKQLTDFYCIGAERFGIGMASALAIIDEAKNCKL